VGGDGFHIFRLARGARLHRAAGLQSGNGLMIGDRLGAGDLRQGALYIVLIHVAIFVGQSAKLLEHFGRFQNRRVFAFDANPAIAGRDFDPQRRADFPQMLIARPKQREQGSGIENRDGVLCHSGEPQKSP
jgi:hypothetical protein